MNSKLHRVIFNAMRGQRMVVQETATSTGKGRNGASAGTGEGQRPWVLRGLVAALALIGWLPVVHAQIVPNPLAVPSQRPQTLVAPNGVPLVNITTPSAGGVSVNHYSQFDVGAPGAILNNSRTTTQTQLGGYIQGNPWLATGSARIIVNQVASSNPSYLNGYVEVAGQRAEVIIANPSGISVNGGGFINASRVTLTTGTPQYGFGGSLDGYVVNGGTVTVDGKGLDLSTTDYAAILSRAVQVNAAIHANDLKVVTGTNQISADYSQVTAASANGPAPAYALDVAALGGMYAGHIVLVGTEAGLGVRNAGKLGASAGSLVVTSAGRLENTGTLEGQSVQLTSASDIDNRGGTIRQTSSASLALAAPTVSNTNGGQIGSEPVSGSSGSNSGSSGGSTWGGSSGGSSGTSSGSSSSGGSSSSTGTSSGGAASAPEPGTLTAAGAILNDGGKIYAGGPITLQTQNLVNNGGTLSVASMSLKQPGFSNQGGSINVSGAFTADLGTLDNTGGTLHAGSLDIATTGDLINVNGTLTSDTDASLQVGGKVDNTRGTLSARAAMTGVVAGATDNTSGTLAANSGLSWGTASLSNDKGSVGSANGSTQLNVTGAITNGQGSLGAGTDLQIQAGSLSNAQGGSVRAEGNLQLSTSGAVTNDGAITAASNTVITAGSVSAGTSSVLGAGINKDGTLAASGDLTVTASNALVANGTNLAAGSLALQGSSVDVSHSTTSASNVSLIGTSGNVDTSAAKVVTPGTLTITANANAAQSLVNTGGTLNAGQLQIAAANINNTAGGQLVQSGTAATTIAVSGTLDNSGGVIAANSQDLSLSATSLVNAGGQIAHAGTGTLTLGGGSFDGAGGEVASNGALAVRLTGAFNQDGGTTSATAISIDAGSLSNKAGQIVQTGTGATHIGVSGALDNTNGTLASNGQTAVTAGTLTNGGGQIRTAGSASLNLTTTGLLDNSHQGTIAAGGTTTVTAGSLDNDTGRITAVQDLGASVAGVASNQGGTLAANGNTTVTAASLNNSGGTVAAVQGDLSVTTSGTTTNAGGTLQAGGSATLTNAGLDNSGGKVFGDRLRIDTQGQELGNAQGTLAATHAVELQTGALRNDAGLVQAGGALSIDTHGQALSNTNAAGYANGQGVLASGDTLTLRAGAVDNSGGFIGSKGALSATTGDVTNAAGQVLGQSTLDWQAGAAGFDNSGGQIQSAGNLSVAAGSVTNTAGLLRSGATTTVTASGSLGNRNTQGTDQGIEGNDVAITAGSLDNTQGAVRANGNTTVTSGGTVDNTGGLLSAGDTLKVADPNAANPGAKTLNLVNTGGTLVADQSVVVDAARFSGDGKLVSGKNLSIALTQDLVNNAEVSANGNLNYGTTGNLTNNGKLLAGQQLTVSGNTVTNAAGAEMSGTDTQVHAGTLDNRGLIDSNGLTRIDAGTVNNVGTGRIYGDHVAIAAGTLNNEEEGSSAATIAARADLDLGVGTFNNREHALVFSAGDMFIGGALDANGHATGTGGTLNNLSATIESLGSMSMDIGQVNNRDTHVQLGPQTVTSGSLSYYATMDGTVWQKLDSAGNVVTWGIPATRTLYHQNPDGSVVVAGIGYADWYVNTQTTTDTATNADPARIAAGGDLTITGHLLNANSRVLAGGALSAGSVDNQALQGQQTVAETSRVAFGYSPNLADPAPVPVFFIGSSTTTTVNVGAYQYVDHTSGTNGYGIGSASTGRADTSAASAGGANAGSHTPTIVEVASQVGSVASTSGKAADSAGGAGGSTNASASASVPTVVRTSTPSITVPSASLFSTTGSAGRDYLIETDPRFANYRHWLSSDYLLNNLGVNPDTALKRLGDGFYEQQLIREQVAQLTGYRFLDGYTNDEDQYTALMNAGVTFAKKFGLTPGVALTAEQMAQLTSDIVWLVEQTVTLPDGTTQKVLVPQVYVRVRPGDIDGSGALLSADRLSIKDENATFRTGGTVAGRTLVSIDTKSIEVLNGRISGGDVALKAKDDINVIGGTVDARKSLDVQAGRDVNVVTTTASQTGLLSSATGVDRVAGLYVSGSSGSLTVSAGRDLNVAGAQVANAGSGITSLSAVRDVNIGTVQVRSSAIGLGRNSIAQLSQNAEVGSTISSGGGLLSIRAGQDLNARQAQIDAGRGIALLGAGRDMVIAAGEASTSVSITATNTKKGLFTSRTTQTQTDASSTRSIGSQIQGGLVWLDAGRDMLLEAAKVDGTQGVGLSAGRDLAIVEGRDTTRVSQDTQTSRTLGGLLVPGNASIKKTGTTLEIATDTANASRITSSQGGVTIQAGGTAALQGVQVDAAKDVNIRGGNVLIRAAENSTTVTGSHTTKSSLLDPGTHVLTDVGKGLKAKETGQTELTRTDLARSSLTGANVSIEATGTAALSATDVNTPGTLTLKGETVVLGTQASETGTRTTSQGRDIVYQVARDSGKTDQTTQYNRLNVGQLDVQANHIQADLGARDSIEQLAKQPGMAWMGQLVNDPKIKDRIDWRQVEELHKQWKEDHQGLTKEGGIIVTAVITWLTWGAASGAGATAGNAAAVGAGEGVALAGGGTFLTATGATMSSVVGGAVAAGISALASQTAVSLIDNQFDLGKTFRALGSSSSVHSLVTAILTGGALAGLNMNPTGLPTAGSGAQGFATQLGQNVQAAAIKALISTAVNGGSLEDNLKQNLITAFIDTAAAQSANAVGTNLAPGSAANVLAHALVGCAVGVARQGNGDGCAPGALGAAIGEMAARLYDPDAQNAQRDTVEFANMIGTLAVGLAGGDAAAMQIGGQAAANAAANNWLATKQKWQMQKEMDAAKTPLQKAAVLAKWFGISAAQDALSTSGVAMGLAAGGISDLQGMAQFLAHPIEGLDALRQLVNSPEVRSQMSASVAAELDAKFARIQTALDEGGSQNAYQLGVDLGSLVWQVGSLAAGGVGVAEAGAKLASAGIKVTGSTLDAMGWGASATAAADRLALQALLKSGGAVDKSGAALLDMRALTTEQKGVMGDLFGQDTMQQIIPDGQKIARMPLVGETGIDDLYKVSRPGVDYVIVEYKFVGQDGKIGSQVLGQTEDGLQASQSWTLGSERLEKAVGADSAIDVRKAFSSGRAETWVVTTRPDGSTYVQVLDALGKPKPVDTSKILSNCTAKGCQP